jgi:hypothetical protein
MFGPKVKIDKALYDRAVAVSAKAGYSSVDEFITAMIEKELAKLEDDTDQKGLEDRLRGLGYIE